ncbi:MAG: electron transport complex subunit RsxG [Rhodocyclaceae bacterium]|nr:electron transport complex subunit RsxG [Rhodocyclaceae bacterium]
MSQSTALGMSLRNSVAMVIFTLAFTGLMASVYQATKEPIAASAEEEKMKLIGEVLPRGDYDNELLKDFVDIGTPPDLGLREAGRAYRARKEGQPSAVLLEAVAPDGYAGDISLLLAIRLDGRIIAVRVTEQKETPGLGDYVDIHKDKKKDNPWIAQFNDIGFSQVSQADWKVKKDGGRFAYHTGATISARAVTNAVSRAQVYFQANKDRLFATPTGGKL